MGNDNSSAINFGPFQDADFECIFTGTKQAPVSSPLLPQQFELGHVQMNNNTDTVLSVRIRTVPRRVWSCSADLI